jgi:hypothetical protein
MSAAVADLVSGGGGRELPAEERLARSAADRGGGVLGTHHEFGMRLRSQLEVSSDGISWAMAAGNVCERQG